MTTSTATHEYASKVDTQISAAWDRVFDAQRKRDSAVDAIHYAAQDKRKYSGRQVVGWMMSFDDAITKMYERLASRPWENASENEQKWVTAANELEAARRVASELELLYTGWARFFIVPGGHIHSSRRCSTCYVTTMFGWLPALSGLTEADAVAAHGPLLCSVCYPSAPVEWTVGPQSKKTYCTGKGKYANAGRYRYAECPDCGKTVAVTPGGGLIRAHQPA